MTTINIKKAFETKNFKDIGLIIDFLRFNHGLNYNQTYQTLSLCKKFKMSFDEYEEILYEVDMWESSQ